MKPAARVVLGSALGIAVSFSPAYFTVFGLYLKPMANEFGWTRGQLSAGVAVTAMTSVVLSPVAGILIDKWGARRVALIGSLLFPLGLLLHAGLNATFPLFLCLALVMGIAASVCSPLTYVSVLPHWLDKRLGLGIALSMAGLGLGQLLFTALTAKLMLVAGWRTSWAVTAAIVAIVGISSAFFLFREAPGRLAARRDPLVAESLEGEEFCVAVKSSAFWFLAIPVIIVSGTGAGTAVHIAALLSDRGAGAAAGAAAITALAMGSLLGRLTSGMMIDRLPFASVGAAIFSGQAIGLLLLANGATGLALPFAMLMIGLAVGAESDIMPYALRRRFGLKSYGRLYGAMFGLYLLGPVAGPWLMGAGFDWMGSYVPMLTAFAVASLVAAAILLLGGATALRLPQHTDNLLNTPAKI